jgi:glycine cleavage system H protein
MTMETLARDPFASKGIEYLLVLAFLALLPLYWRYLNGVPRLALARVRAAERGALSGWFRLPEAAYFHPGHTWAVPVRADRVRIGVDDYAQKLLGTAQSVALPAIGDRLTGGGRAWTLDVGDHAFDLPAPVRGRVVARNQAVLDRPALLNEDPYGRGWLLELEVPAWRPGLRSLLHGDRAAAWLGRAENALRLRMSPEVGAVLQDGGVPVAGIARALSPDDWDRLARELLTHA